MKKKLVVILTIFILTNCSDKNKTVDVSENKDALSKDLLNPSPTDKLLTSMPPQDIAPTLSQSETAVKIKFFNKTGHDITDLIVLNQKINLLKSNDSTSFMKFDSILFCGIAPCVGPKGSIKNLKLNRTHGYCGNGTEYKKTGEFKNDIILYTNEDDHEIWFGQHKKGRP